MSKLRTDMDKGYQQNALNCWIAALLYLVTLCVSAQQFWMNNRSTYRLISTKQENSNLIFSACDFLNQISRSTMEKDLSD